MKTRYSAALLFLALLGACGDPSGPYSRSDSNLSPITTAGIVLEMDRSSYPHGSTATVRLKNGSSDTIGYNLCSVVYERRVGQTWARISPLRLCTAAFFPLAPGAETTSTESITAEWEPGEYRLSSSVLVDSRTQAVETVPFTISQ